MTGEVSVYCLPVYLISRKGNSNSRVVHAPAGEGSDRPLCEHTREGGGNSNGEYGYRRKPSAVIPNGYYPECSRCRDALGSMPPGWRP